MKPETPEEIIRLVKLARCPGERIGELCAKHGISAATFRRWRKQYAEEARWTKDDVWLATLYFGGDPMTIDRIVAVYDYIDHARYPEEEALAILKRLEAEGWVRHEGETWTLARPWP